MSHDLTLRSIILCIRYCFGFSRIGPLFHVPAIRCSCAGDFLFVKNYNGLISYDYPAVSNAAKV